MLKLVEETISTNKTPEDIFFKDLDQEEVTNIISRLTNEERELIIPLFLRRVKL